MNTEDSVSTDVAASPTAAPSAGAAQLDPRGLLAKLQEVSVTFRDFKPVALRIDKSIMGRFPDLDKKVVRIAMRMHTASTRYLKAVEKGSHRYDLDGNESGELTQEHREHAAQTLKERFAEAAKKKRERQKEELDRQRAEEAERRKAEKLQQLVGRFAKR